MSAFGKQVEVKEGLEVKLYTGVENFKVVAINPSKEELEKMYGREIKFTPEYVGTTKVTDGDGEREVTQVRLDLFLSNEDDSITTKLQFYVADTHHKSATGKFKVINSFGRSTWLDPEDIKSKEPLSHMTWYNLDGVKIARRGEVELISSLVNLLNLPINLDKVSDLSEAYARIDKNEWAKIFTGDVTLLRNIIAGTNNKVGVLLGVKTKGDGKLVQATLNRHTLRQYSLPSKRADKYKWLLKDLDGATAAGSYGNVDFGPKDCLLREHSMESTVISDKNTNQEDVFASSQNTTSPELQAGSEDKNWFDEN